MNAKGRGSSLTKFGISRIWTAMLIGFFLFAASNISLASDRTNATLNGLYSSQGVDLDRDGLYDSMDLKVGLNVAVPGIYEVRGQLKPADENWSQIRQASSKAYLSFGAKSVILRFYATCWPGSYQLGNLTLSDNCGRTLDRIDEAYRTSNYSYLDPDPRIAILTGDFIDQGEDVNRDGRFELLTVDAGIYVFFPGQYTLTAYLYDLNGSEVAWSIDNGDFEVGNQTMHLKFDGALIRKHGVDGPYRLERLVLAGQKWAIMESESYAKNTSAYRCSDFVEPEQPESEKMIFGTGKGELALTVVIKHTVPVLSGMYSYDIMGINIPPISTPMVITSSRGGYSYNLTDVYMPSKPNNFSVSAKGVRNLNIGLKKDPVKEGLNFTRVWVTAQIPADNEGKATTESDLLSPGSYQFKLFGEAAENISEVDLTMTLVKNIIVNGSFSLALNTSGFPSGDYSLSARALNGSFKFDEITVGGLAIAD
jgi:hypothetical protein